MSRILQVFVETPDAPEFSMVIDAISELMQQISDSSGITWTGLWCDTKQLYLTPSRSIRSCAIGEGTHLRTA